MAYYHSPKEYEVKTGKRFSDKGASIHRTGSVKGISNVYVEIKVVFNWRKSYDERRITERIKIWCEIRGYI